MTIRKNESPRKAREPLRQKVGDRPRYGLRESGTSTDRTQANEAGDPFASFSEWADAADGETYRTL